ncbi:DUF1820 family protein [Sinobacterium caligoides]|nr:DUF1820 family protein [Sinobacterium caligoides]
MASSPVYKVVFLNHEQIIELYARAIFQSDLYGFVEVEEFIFEPGGDQEGDKLRDDFAGVKRSYLPMHNIIRIDEVEKEGVSKVSDATAQHSKVMPFPVRSALKVPDAPEPTE